MMDLKFLPFDGFRAMAPLGEPQARSAETV